jgi:hypothetical protein
VAGDGEVEVSGSRKGDTSEEDTESTKESAGQTKEDEVEPMTWIGEQTPLTCGNEEEVDKWNGTGMPHEEYNVAMWKPPTVDANEEENNDKISDVEVETVATEEETEWDSSNSENEWEDVEELETDTSIELSLPQHLGLDPPRLESGARVSGINKRQLRRENKAKRRQRQLEQVEDTYWEIYRGEFVMPEAKQEQKEWRNMMCPKGLALHHPAAAKLLEYATGGCPANTGKEWTKAQMWAAVERGPHVSALKPDAIKQLKTEIADKVKVGQCKVVLWDDIKENPPPQLKISPLAMIPP